MATSFIDVGILEATELVESRLSNLLVCFDCPKLYEKLAAYASIEGLPEGVTEALARGDVQPLAAFQERAFVVLWNRGAFHDLVKLELNGLATEELQELVDRVGVAIRSVKP